MNPRFLLATLLMLLLYTQSILAQEALPVGNHPPALEFPHFPNKLYAVVWRNWNLVSPERIALTVAATPKQIIETANAMGLLRPAVIARL